MVKQPNQEDRQGGEARTVLLGADVGGRSQLADVEFIGAHHAPEGGDQRIDLLKVEGKGL